MRRFPILGYLAAFLGTLGSCLEGKPKKEAYLDFVRTISSLCLELQRMRARTHFLKFETIKAERNPNKPPFSVLHLANVLRNPRKQLGVPGLHFNM